MEPQLTADQTRAAQHRGPLAVIAGAGTGKTLTMVERYLRLVADGVEPSAIVAVTFTRAAAAELRARVRAALLGNDTSRGTSVDAALITTFDGLNHHLVRAYPWAHDLGTDVDVEDPEIGAATASIEAGALLATALGTSTLPGSLALVQALADEAQRQPQRTMAALAVPSAPARDDHVRRARAFWSDVAGRLGVALAETTTSTEAQRRFLTEVQLLANAIDAWLATPHDDASELVIAARSIGLRSRGAGVDQLRAVVKELREALDDPARHWQALGWTSADELVATRQPQLAAVAEAVIRAGDERRKSVGVASFGAIERAALAVLADPTARAELADRWHAVIVDEFQDVSENQLRLVELLTHVVEGRTAVVGDPKQAIYAFRGARPELATSFAERSAVIQLEQSFRSLPRIIDLANDYARRALDASERLTPTRTAPSEDGSIAVIQVVGGSVAERRQAAAHAVASRLEREIADGTLRARDIAVVARRWAELDDYRRELGACGIAAIASGGGSLLDTNVGLLVSSILRWLANPLDDAAAIAVARADVIGFRDDELVAFAAERDHTQPWATLLESLDDPRARRLRNLRLATRGASAPAAIMAALEMLEIDDALAAGPDPERTLADLHAMVSLVARFSTGRSLEEVVATIERLRTTGVSLPRPPVAGADAVTLTTVHGAKGLEWPLVITVGLENDPHPALPEGLVLHPTLGVAWNDRDERHQSSRAVEIGARLEHERKEEQRRLTYVALTRARDALIVVLDGDKDSALRESLREVGTTEWTTIDAHPDGPDAHQPTDATVTSARDLTVPPPPVDDEASEPARVPPPRATPRTIAALAATLTCPWLAHWCGPEGADALRHPTTGLVWAPDESAALLGVDPTIPLVPTVHDLRLGSSTLTGVTLSVTDVAVIVPVRNTRAAEPEARLAAALSARALERPTAVLLAVDEGVTTVVDAVAPDDVPIATTPPCERCRFRRRCPGSRATLDSVLHPTLVDEA